MDKPRHPQVIRTLEDALEDSSLPDNQHWPVLHFVPRQFDVAEWLRVLCAGTDIFQRY